MKQDERTYQFKCKSTISNRSASRQDTRNRFHECTVPSLLKDCKYPWAASMFPLPKASKGNLSWFNRKNDETIWRKFPRKSTSKWRLITLDLFPRSYWIQEESNELRPNLISSSKLCPLGCSCSTHVKMWYPSTHQCLRKINYYYHRDVSSLLPCILLLSRFGKDDAVV